MAVWIYAVKLSKIFFFSGKMFEEKQKKTKNLNF